MRLGSITLAVAIVAGLGWWFLLREPETTVALAIATPEGANPAPPVVPREAPVRVMTLLSRAEPAVSELRLRGRTEANREVVVRAETDGLIASEPLRAGARIGRDDLLCRLHMGARAAELRKTEAALERARIEAEAADRLSAQGFTAETTRAERQAAFESAKADLDAMRLDIARLDIRAPFSGQLDSDTAELGTLLNRGDACATLVDLATIKVVAFVSERQVDRLAIDQAVTVRFIDGALREGAIRFVAARADTATRTFRVEAALDNSDGTLRDGMTAEIKVVTTSGLAHKLPQSALTLNDDGDLGVRVVEDGRAAFVPVRLLNDTEDAAFVDGLPATARVIVVGQEFVTDGSPIIAVPIQSALSRGDFSEPASMPDPAGITPPSMDAELGRESRG